MLLALTDSQKTLWWTAVILGFVVVLAVAALLTILVTLVRKIDQRVDLIAGSLVAAEASTSQTSLISPTADAVDSVLAEGLEHHLFLGRVLDKVRS